MSHVGKCAMCRGPLSEMHERESGITPPPPPPASDPKTKYIEMLMEKAANSDTLDTALLDRIEKLLGYPTSGEANA